MDTEKSLHLTFENVKSLIRLYASTRRHKALDISWEQIIFV